MTALAIQNAIKKLLPVAKRALVTSAFPDCPFALWVVHQVELTLDRSQWIHYGYALWDVVNPDPDQNPFTWYCADAPQRTEALLRLLHLWTTKEDTANAGPEIKTSDGRNSVGDKKT